MGNRPLLRKKFRCLGKTRDKDLLFSLHILFQIFCVIVTIQKKNILKAVCVRASKSIALQFSWQSSLTSFAIISHVLLRHPTNDVLGMGRL